MLKVANSIAIYCFTTVHCLLAVQLLRSSQLAATSNGLSSSILINYFDDNAKLLSCLYRFIAL